MLDSGPSASEPEILDPKQEKQRIRIEELEQNPLVKKIDNLAHQLGELYRIQSLLHDSVKISADAYQGVWVYYPWVETMVRMLSECDFVEVRTNRNRNKITNEEQDILSKKRIGIIGMSVGRSVATTMSLERTFGHLKIADFDTVDLSNLNRIKSSVLDLGMKKTDSAYREIKLLDPFLSIETYDGISADNIEQFLLDGGKLDLLVDECDNLEVKILCRQMARKHGIPVVMETSDRGMLDIERFDLEKDRKIFHGMLGDKEPLLNELKDATIRNQVLMSILDIGKVSKRGLNSLQEVGKTLLTWPQLGSAVTLGGGSVTDVSRRILLGEHKQSGRFYVDLSQLTSV